MCFFYLIFTLTHLVFGFLIFVCIYIYIYIDGWIYVNRYVLDMFYVLKLVRRRTYTDAFQDFQISFSCQDM